MVIGQFCETFPPMIDGVGRVMQAYCDTLGKLGHTAYYIAPADKERTQMEGINEILYNGIRIPGQPYRVGKPELSVGYKKRIKNIDFDVVHAHAPFFAANAAKRIAKKRNIPLVATFHSKYYDDVLKATHSKTLARLVVWYAVRFYKKCDEVWTVNEGTKKVLQSYGYQGNIIVMENGTDLYELNDNSYKKYVNELQISDDIPVLLFVGQLDVKKNIDSILRACSILNNRGEDFILYLVGQGQDGKRLHKLSVDLGIEDKVHFLGFVSDGEKLHAIYKRANLFVFPSVYDNAPMTVREAASVGTPPLLVRGTCSAENIEDGVNGFLCDNSPESIAEKIMEALPMAEEVGQHAKQTIPIPWIGIMRKIEARYGELCNKRRNSN